MKRPLVLVLGPSREAISGVSTHVNSLLGSKLGSEFTLEHFQVGSEGREEGALRRLLRLALSPLALAAAILVRDARIVHLNTSLNARAWWRDLVYVLIARLCGARVVLQVHGGVLERFASSPLLASFVRLARRWPDAIVVLSTSEHEAWRRVAAAQNVAVLPNGIDCAPYRRYNRNFPQAGEPLRLIYVGRLAPAKGLSETIRGLAIAKARGVAARLVIAGSGPEEARLRQEAREAGIENEVSFAGPAYGDHKALLLSQSDVLCLPSYSEGLPYALLEAMAAGVVPIVTRVGAIPDVVGEGVHGVFVPARDAGAIGAAIARLAADRAGLVCMSAACRKRIAGVYSIERVASGFSGLYSALCAARAPKAVL